MRSSEEFERKEKIIINNRRARHDYTIIETIEVGIVLKGTEVKSLRAGKCSLQDAYAGFKSKDDYELWLFNMHINEYDFGNRENHSPKRARKLLLQHREVSKMKTAVMEKGVTLIPLNLYFSGHLVKVEIAYAKAKRQYDKREADKDRQVKKELNRKFKL